MLEHVVCAIDGVESFVGSIVQTGGSCGSVSAAKKHYCSSSETMFATVSLEIVSRIFNMPVRLSAL